ncbi:MULTISPECIES: ribokinase [unclassified Mesorhizobium]|uniref:ribokinase n=1 Tax=unclassified Mesorhizobium TaxID=325217 RepID=UPI000BAF8EAB|nr:MULTISPECIES: ribokinase [unclassified Mesorhizobium]TGT61103.1 ribokinase [Mesorhizobium sp. M00.F.Ca.ET.170.01.1.1]AZO08873.1 ribokinase [Mesorhizobium sp. M3A.F.Ca.ET.080.04.2.1]PBB84262.1 ribokinase [Mesorhizobium sp. WSM3876]RWB67469.1 MAG: ribokinase [Mesorhizobium sp.]RWB84659.1 MAG: ribokinase [Mesorhizobium sp.]
MRVHVVGNVCIDTTFRLDRFPQPGETLNASSHADGLGGKGANQAVAAARCGADVRFRAAIGNDAAGAWISEQLSRYLDIGYLTTLPLPSDRSTIMVEPGGENLIVTGASCAAAFDPLAEDGFLSSIEPGDIGVMQGNLGEDATAACLRAMRGAGAVTIFNPSPLAAGHAPPLDSVSLVVINTVEAAQLTGYSDPAMAARELIRKGAAGAIVTLGASGCLVADGEARIEMLAAPKVAVADTSGAGDVFCGCLAGCLACGMDLAAAARIAVRAAAISVGRPGTLGSCPTRQEMKMLMETGQVQNA